MEQIEEGIKVGLVGRGFLSEIGHDNLSGSDRMAPAVIVCLATKTFFPNGMWDKEEISFRKAIEDYNNALEMLRIDRTTVFNHTFSPSQEDAIEPTTEIVLKKVCEKSQLNYNEIKESCIPVRGRFASIVVHHSQKTQNWNLDRSALWETSPRSVVYLRNLFEEIKPIKNSMVYFSKIETYCFSTVNLGPISIH